MTQPDQNPAETPQAVTPHAITFPRRRRVIVGFALGFLLFAAAVWGFLSHTAAVDLAWNSLRTAHPLVFTLLVALPLLNWVLSSESFLTLTRRFAPVPRTDMLALVGAAWLLNYLPLRPGLFGRVAYHKAVHGVRVRDSARVILQSILATAFALAALAAAAILSRTLGPAPIFALLVFAPGLVMAAWFAGDRLHPASAFLAVLGLKVLDGFAWSARYLLAFQLAGSPIGPTEALALAVVAQAAMLIPIAGNGLGVREWAVALLAASLPSWYSPQFAPDGTAVPTMSVALAADLLCRAAELIAAVPTGLACTAKLARAARPAATRE